MLLKLQLSSDESQDYLVASTVVNFGFEKFPRLSRSLHVLHDFPDIHDFHGIM